MLTEEYKAAVGKYPTGVTVISTSFADKFYGFTANSFTSVSLHPPIVSFCLEKKAASLVGFEKNNHFAISILAFDQAAMSNHFARHADDKFMNIDFSIGEMSNCPILNEAPSYVECKKIEQIECGDHFIFLGKVLNVKICNDKPPLVYFARSYSKIE